MSPPESEVAQLFAALESNRQAEANEAKAKLGELLATVKDTWPVAGLVNYQFTTGSTRIVDVLVKAPVPHDKYLCDRLYESVRTGGWRVPALGLFGHVVRRQPSWLHKVVGMPLFKELLAVLKTEREIVPLVSGLLSLIALLPMIPTLLAPYLQDFFAIFSRLASWENHANPEFASDGRKEHLQLALYGLFQNLYGMFPCNFIDFLKREYNCDENSRVFYHTVRPMLETVKMHPLLITASKNTETDCDRWKKMEHHDVLVECRRFSSENAHRDDRSFRSRCGTDVSSLAAASNAHLQTAKSSYSTPDLTEPRTAPPATTAVRPPDPRINADMFEPGGDRWFSLYEACGVSSTLSAPQTPLPPGANHFQDAPSSQTPVSQIPSVAKRRDDGSPPEAAIEATPENTPVKDGRQRFNFPNNSPAVRALGSRLSQPNQPAPSSSSSHSQPPSPLKKELSPFNRMSSTEGDGDHRKDAFYAQTKLNRVLQDRSQQTSENFLSSAVPSPQRSSAVGSPLKRPPHSRDARTPSVPNSPVPLGMTAPVSGSTDWPLAKPRPHRDGVPLDAKESPHHLSLAPPVDGVNRDDREIIEINRRGEVMRNAHQNDNDNNDEADEHWAEDEMTCDGEGPRCTEKKHGLHMPHSATILYYHATKRSRFLSQCVAENADSSVSSSDAETGLKNDETGSKTVRKSTSWPDIKKASREHHPSPAPPKAVPVDREKKEPLVYQNGKPSDPVAKKSAHVGIQTLEVWPLEYEHLFANVLKNSPDGNAKNDASSTDDNFDSDFSPYDQVDRYIEILSQSKPGKPSEDKKTPREEINFLKQQLELTHLELLYERHRREVHAFRNRRLLGRSRKNRATEEQNASLTKQVLQLTAENDDLRQQIVRQKQALQTMEVKQQEVSKYWQQQMSARDAEVQSERAEKERLAASLLEQRTVSNESFADVQNLHSTIFDISQQLQRATRKSEMGDRQMDCIKRMQRELIMCGERDAKYREIIGASPSKADLLVAKLTQQYKEQLVNAQSLLQSQTSKMEYLQARETDLESAVSHKETVIQELKKQTRLVKEEYSEKLRSAEDRYQSVKRTNHRMEAYCLELLQRVPHSPQTMSRDVTSGFSPQSSPLSASLASSEGHGPLLASKVDEIKNLQVIVNAHETIEESLSNSLNNSNFDDDTH